MAYAAPPPAAARPALASPPRGSTLISRYCKLDTDGSTKTGTWEAQDDDSEQLRQPRDDRGGRRVARDIPPGRGRWQREPPLQPQDPAGEPAPQRGRRQHHR